jgi:protein-disulfide isomerase
MKSRSKILAAIGAVAMTGAVLLASHTDVAAQSTTTNTAGNWSNRVTQSDMGGHILGNPLAQTRVVEYMSYTCPHCAHFEAEAKGPLRKLFISKGTTNFELRNSVRDPIDLTVALLARCGGKNRFFSNHAALLGSQSVWLGKATNASEAVQKSWYEGDFDSRLKKIASDLGLYSQMADLNINKAKVDQCLSDKAAQQAIVAMTKYANETVKIEGTPSFTVNGSLLKGVHDWKLLEQRLSRR